MATAMHTVTVKTFRVATGADVVDSNVAWAESEGLDPTAISVDSLHIFEFQRNAEGAKFLDGQMDGYAKRPFSAHVKTMPPATIPTI